MPRPISVVCVSHLTGAEGEAVARGVAERLGFRYLDEEIIETAADWAHIDPSVVGEVERRKSLISRISDAIRTDPMPARPDAAAQGRSTVAAARERPTDEDLRELIRDAVRETAAEGNIVIASHAAAMALAGRDDILRVLVTASAGTRAARIAAADDVDARSSEKLVAEADVSRADYFKRFYNIDPELPTHYDIVVNTDDLSADVAADLVVLAAKNG